MAYTYLGIQSFVVIIYLLFIDYDLYLLPD